MLVSTLGAWMYKEEDYKKEKQTTKELSAQKQSTPVEVSKL